MIGKTNSRCSSKPHRTLQLSYPSARAPQKPIRFPDFLKVGIAAAFLALCPKQASSQEIEYRSLPELINSGSHALVQGNFPAAAQAFNAIVENYNEEPIWLDGQLPAKILPLAGFASHKSNLHSEAIAALQTYLANYASELDSTLFARYTLAASLLLDGQEQPARGAFAALRQNAGHTPFRDLATLREAQLSEPQIASELLQKLLRNPASPRLANYARLRLIQLDLEQGKIENARIQLLDTDWNQIAMPELATLSLLASQVADSLLLERPQEALQAYQLVQSKTDLIEAQQSRIKELKYTYQTLAPALRTEQSMWSDQFRQSIKSLETQLQDLRETPDYAETIALRKARCFAQINRPIEAWILLEPIANSTNELAREAHLEWISTARSMHAWNSAANIAQSFIQKYPNDNDIPQVLLWIALAQIEQENFPQAIESLQAILAASPTKQLQAASLYYIGYSQFNLGNKTAAIAAFEKCHASGPDLPVAAQAHLWIGICQFTTNKLENAIATFQAIQNAPQHPLLRPEAAFRETACHYALGDLDKALQQTETWLATYPNHAREAEVHLLQGDTYAELGQIESAIESYAQVESADPQLTFLALEKRSSLLLETKRNEEAQQILQAYRNSAPIPPPFIGTFTQLLASALPEAQAQQEIEQAIQSYGNKLYAEGIIELIQLLSDLPAQDPKQPTLQSRLQVASIQTLRQQGHPSQAKLKALDLASLFDIADLPPPALIEAGNALAEIASLDSPRYFEKLLKLYPDSKYADDAYSGLARYHANSENPSIALAYLLQSSSKTPEDLSLKLELETELHQFKAAKQTAEQILADRQSLPSAKAKALLSLGNIARNSKDSATAYIYFQRVFTLYRGETEQVANAYLSCIQILTAENRFSDAQKVAAEFLAQDDLTQQPAYQAAKQWTTNSKNVPPPPPTF